jgi:hypothetical protein
MRSVSFRDDRALRASLWGSEFGVWVSGERRARAVTFCQLAEEKKSIANGHASEAAPQTGEMQGCQGGVWGAD